VDHKRNPGIKEKLGDDDGGDGDGDAVRGG